MLLLYLQIRCVMGSPPPVAPLRVRRDFVSAKAERGVVVGAGRGAGVHRCGEGGCRIVCISAAHTHRIRPSY